MRNARTCLLASMTLLASGSFAANPPGYPSRAEDLDVRPGFRTPPPGYGEVAFYWWLGDPLTKERLGWQLDQLKNKSVSALQVNYAHSDKGGRFWGLTFASEPPLFSAPWWDLFGWFLKAAKQRGMAASLSDYTLGWAGNGWYMDEILSEHPDMHGAELDRESRDCAGSCAWEFSNTPLSVSAFRTRGGRIVAGSRVDLNGQTSGRRLRWNAPEGSWRVISVYAKDVKVSLDPMHPQSGKQMIEKFFQRFEDRNPGESGIGLNFFFSDELSFGVKGWIWNSFVAREFLKRKGYDVVPELASLFEETDPRAVKVRLDYSDVIVTLSEEHYFKPLYDWHHSRGMLYGCDHGGRGRDVTEFGDYFRTQRWMTGPGNDQPNLAADIIKNKVASSIAHLYERERTWLEGFYGSGWGTTSAQIADATWRNFAQGHNLLTLHGLYYSTRGGWWEWAPPCNHFHMPYWAHMGEFLRASERMSYLLSQGRHRADVAVVYPVAAVEGGLSGKESVSAAFSLGKHLYEQGIDFDFIDFESVVRAKVEERKLRVAGEEYRVLVLPAMRSVRHAMLEKAVEFHRGGGMVVVLGAAPEASEKSGAGDAEVLSMARELAGSRTRNNEETTAKIQGAFPRDFACRAAEQPSVLHRKAGRRDIYMVYGARRNTECSFRSTGRVELWDPWTGNTSEQAVVAQSGGTTTLRMPLESTEAQVIVFEAGTPRIEQRTAEAKRTVIPVEGGWEFELKPTLDNRFGDYRLPPSNRLLGAEARRFRYADEVSSSFSGSDPKLDDSKWVETSATFGPRFWKLGPLPARPDAAPATLANPPVPIAIEGEEHRWQPYEFSFRWGIENDPGHQGYHGLKGEVPDDFIGLGKLENKPTTTLYTREWEGQYYYLWTTAFAPRAMRARVVQGGELLPAAIWVNGLPVAAGAAAVELKAGANPVLLRYDKPGRGHFLFLDPGSPVEWKQTYPLASTWFERPGVLRFDTRPQEAHPAGWYRTDSPPGMRGLSIVARGTAKLWVDGRAVPMLAPRRRADGANEYRVALRKALAAPAKVAIRIAQQRGAYAGAALAEPVEFECGPGELGAGDWSRVAGLASYSGGAWYRKTITLSAAQVAQPVELDLGEVSSSAEILVNGRQAGIKLAPPFRVDVSELVKAGSNRVEVLVYSTLSNHYQTIPTRYRRPGPSGLIGPVTLVLGKR